MKRTFALIVMVMMLVLSTACAAPAAPAASGNDDWSYIQSKGTLVIGYTEYAPMNYTENGTLVGFDTEFAEAVCAKLNLKPEFVEIDWDTKELELAGKKIDCIWNGLTVTEERKANMDFTVSYLKNQQVVVIRTADAEKYPDAASLAGAVVVAEAGSAGAAAIAANLPDSEFIEVQAQSDALLEVKTGKAAAAVIDLTMAKAMTGESTDYSDLSIAPIDMMDEEYAIGFRVGSSAKAKVDEAIAALTADGTIAAIAKKYDLTDLLIQ
ncbi:MAG: transporter substrate-binding domain-containing protein [Christensenella sp.]|nr:transporter substrate-binding domain-containing protein [Christensenella sp.]